jgi:two-component system, OmpR family, sensor kinase
MNRQSIFFTITVGFIISIILVLLSFSILITHSYKIRQMQIIDKYESVIRIVFRQSKYGFNEEFVNRLKEINYILITNKNKIDAITYNPKTKVLAERRSPQHRNNRKELLRVLNLNDKNYIYMNIARRGWIVLVQDNNTKSFSGSNISLYIMLVFATVFIMIVLVYLITYRKLMPLKILKDKVKTLGDENFDFECCNTNRKDEVSLLALEFKNTAEKLRDVKESRNIFIRNIMHELKTPITKGKFLTEIERNDKNDKKLKEVFSRLESLINEFASIEELISSTKNIEKNIYYLNDIIDNAKDILMVDENEVIESYEDKKIEVNYKLFSIAIKNLIDNAIKYSPDKKVKIRTEDENIIFENLGEKLEYDLEKYYEPFFANEDKSKNSFGLGLYIVYNILKANGYSLDYDYVDGKNIFICKKDNQ